MTLFCSILNLSDEAEVRSFSVEVMGYSGEGDAVVSTSPLFQPLQLTGGDMAEGTSLVLSLKQSHVICLVSSS